MELVTLLVRGAEPRRNDACCGWKPHMGCLEGSVLKGKRPLETRSSGQGGWLPEDFTEDNNDNGCRLGP